MSRANSVGCKGELRRCIACGDVKIWDYPNVRKCPTGKNHKWRPIEESDLTKEENKSIDEQIKYDEENVDHKFSYFDSKSKKIIRTSYSKLNDVLSEKSSEEEDE